MGGLHTASVRLGIGAEQHVILNGADVSDSVRGLRIDGAFDRLPRLVLEIDLWEQLVEGKVLVEVPPETHRTLVAIGWTPPPGEVGPDADGPTATASPRAPS